MKSSLFASLVAAVASQDLFLAKQNSTGMTRPSPCTPAGSIPGGSCQPCKEDVQCSSGFCCPFMKKCVTSSSQSCYSPIANCRPTCFTASCSSCSPSDGSDYNSDWGAPTCGEPSPSPSPTPSPTPPPSTGVTCGAHTAPSCADCPWSNGQWMGSGWCNGECQWTGSACESGSSPAPSPSPPESGDSCLNFMNGLRANYGLPTMTLKSSAKSCAANQAAGDAASYAHAHFGECGEYGQCEAWGTSTCEEGMQMYYDEGPSGGHYQIIMGSYTQMAYGHCENCGSYGTGWTMDFW